MNPQDSGLESDSSAASSIRHAAVNVLLILVSAFCGERMEQHVGDDSENARHHWAEDALGLIGRITIQQITARRALRKGRRHSSLVLYAS